MAYYRHAEYKTEAEMKKQGKSEAEKMKQRELNWNIRLENYAKNNRNQFRKMVDDWAESALEHIEISSLSPTDASTMKMLHILKLSRENGILSETIGEFSCAESELIYANPGFVSPAAVPFNQEKKNECSIAALKAAVSKKEKKAAAILARSAGKAAAALKRAAIENAWTERLQKGRIEIEKKTAVARKAIGLRKNEENPISIRNMISQWEFELNVELYAARLSV